MKIEDLFEICVFLFFVALGIFFIIAVVMSGCQSYRKTEIEIEYLKRKNHDVKIDIKTGG